MKKVAVILFAALLLLALGCGLKLFVIGEPADGDTLVIEVKEQKGQVTIYIDSPDSAMAISNIRYRYEGTKLYMTVRRVLSSPLHRDGSKCIYYEITDETEIWLGGRLIWSAQ